MQTKVVTIANGIRVLIVNNPNVQSVTVGAFTNVGARNETKKLNGISHFLEHMAFKGTSNRDYLKIASDAERLGASMNAYTSRDRTAYHMGGLAKHLPTFVEIIGDILSNSLLPEDEIERERGVIVQEFERYQDNPSAIAYYQFEKARYGDSSYGRTILGPKANILRFTRDDFKGYMDKHYTGRNIIVAIAGNVDEDQAVKLVEQHFGGIPAGMETVVELPEFKGGIQSLKRSFKQSHVVVGFEAATLREDFYADLVAGELLGGGMSSPLFVEVREKRGLAYSIASSTDFADNNGQMYMFAGTTEEYLDQMFDTIGDVLLSHTQKIDPLDLERAINSLLVHEIRKTERPFAVATNAVEDLFTHGKVGDTNEFVRRVEAVTVEDVKASVARMISKPASVAVVGKGSDDRFLASLEKKLKG